MSKRKDFKKLDKRVNWVVKTMNKQVSKDFGDRYFFQQVSKTRDRIMTEVRYFTFELEDRKYPERNKKVRFSGWPLLGSNPFLTYELYRAYNNFIIEGESYASTDEKGVTGSLQTC